jgi:hypothetical protein
MKPYERFSTMGSIDNIRQYLLDEYKSQKTKQNRVKKKQEIRQTIDNDFTRTHSQRSLCRTIAPGEKYKMDAAY